MSVNREDYIIIGVDLIVYNERLNELEECTDIEAWKEREKKEKEANDLGLEFVFDAFDEKYLVVGKLLAKGNEYEGIKFTEINPDRMNETSVKVAEKIKKVFGIDVKPTLLVFTHWC